MAGFIRRCRAHIVFNCLLISKEQRLHMQIQISDFFINIRASNTDPTLS